MNVRLAIGRRVARITTTLVVRWPALWRLLRRPMELEFDLLAPRWETIRAEHNLAPLDTWEPVEYGLVYSKVLPPCMHDEFLAEVARAVIEQAEHPCQVLRTALSKAKLAMPMTVCYRRLSRSRSRQSWRIPGSMPPMTRQSTRRSSNWND